MRIRISFNSNLFRFLFRFWTRFFLVLQPFLDGGEECLVPGCRRLVQGLPAREVFRKLWRIEEIGVQKLVEKNFRSGKLVRHLPHSSFEIPETDPDLCLEPLLVQEFFLDYGTRQRGEGHLVGPGQFLQMTVVVFGKTHGDLARFQSRSPSFGLLFG